MIKILKEFKKVIDYFFLSVFIFILVWRKELEPLFRHPIFGFLANDAEEILPYSINITDHSVIF